jgi:hypothetical protein
MSDSPAIENLTNAKSGAVTIPSAGNAHGTSRATQLKVAASRAGDFAAQEAALAPVQRHGGKDGTESVHAAAAHGISGGGGSMPHGAAIQKAFGGYDLSNVQAHTDAKASEGASAMGADAYATGNHIAFNGAPDLHTAAHEAAHVVQQQAGVQLSGGVGTVGDPYEQHADKVADAVVAGQSAEPILAEMAGGSGGGTGVQQAVQRQETPTPTPTPHADAALDHVRNNGIGGGATTGETTTEEPKPITVPQTYDAYVVHIRTKFAAELAAIEELKAKQVQKGGEAEEKEAKLALDAEELNWYRYELDVLGREVEELTKEQQARHATLEAIKGYQGMTMEQMHAKMEELIATYASKLGRLAESERAEIESLMYASIELGGQLNPDASGAVRLLYLDKIDNQENPRLVAVAESEGMEPAQLAEMGVKYRTWSKTFVRTELMDNKLAAEILFMRDLGADGNQIGVTPEALAEKLFARAQAKAKVPADKQIPFSQADQQQELDIYKAMLAKAKETNPNVNAALTAPRMRRPLDLPDDQPSPTPGATTPTGP